MADAFDKYNFIIGVGITFLSSILGQYWYIFVAFLIFNILDWLTGWYKARKLRKESSKVGLEGILKKLGYWVIIAVAFLISDIFVKMGNSMLNINLDLLYLLGYFTLASLMVNEIRSILENLVALGYNVPVFLVKGLAVTEKLLDQKAEDIIDEFMQKNEIDSNKKIK